MKFCIWGNIAAAIDGKPDGGGELQTAMLAKVLAKSGHDVNLVDLRVKNDYVTDDGIKVFHVEGWNNGTRSLRFFTHRLPQLYSCLKSQNADIYYCQIRDFIPVLGLKAARKSKGKFVIQLASDLDAMNIRMRLKYDYLTNICGLWWFVKVALTEMFWPGLVRKADLLLVQHDGQKNLLIKKGIKSVIFNNLIDINNIKVNSDPAKNSYCYVGSLDRRKGFPEFFELVKKAPSVTFKVIGKPRDKTGYSIYEEMKSLKNVTLYGKLNHSEVIEQISNSKGLISTSPMEGFPNIFVEAWACGVPVFSLHFDPGSIIEKEKLGIVTKGDINELAKLLTTVSINGDSGERAKAYVINNHALTENKIREINLLFENLMKEKP
jgi:glycosyltransferase involved in cell wall biosynthesis